MCKDFAFMMYAMEQEGEVDTHEGRLHRLAKTLNESSSDVIDTDEFLEACEELGMDPDELDAEDIERIQDMLD